MTKVEIIVDDGLFISIAGRNGSFALNDRETVHVTSDGELNFLVQRTEEDDVCLFHVE